MADGHFSHLDVDTEIVANDIAVRGIIRGTEGGGNILNVKGSIKLDDGTIHGRGHFSHLDVDTEIVANDIVANDIAVRGIIRGTEGGGNILNVKGIIKAEDVLINSSQELKHDVSPLSYTEASQLIEDLEPVKFAFKNDPSKKENIGFIAEDVPDIMSDKDHKSVRYMEIISALTKVVKDLKNEVNELKENH